MKNIVSTIILFLLLCVLSAGAEVRTWTSGKHTVEAELIEVSKDKKSVTLRRSDNGKEVVLAMTKLSAEDQAYVKKTSQKKSEPPRLTGKPEEPMKHKLDAATQRKIAIFIAEFGADVKSKDREGLTLLYKAVAMNEVELVRFVLDKGADVNIKNNNGATALYLAVTQDRFEIAKLLIARGADINTKNNSGATTLHLAVIQKQPEIVKLLVSEGADVNAKDIKGATPLGYAALFGELEIAKTLVSGGAEIDDQKVRMARSKGHTKLEEFLVSEMQRSIKKETVKKPDAATQQKIDEFVKEFGDNEQKKSTPDIRVLDEKLSKALIGKSKEWDLPLPPEFYSTTIPTILKMSIETKEAILKDFPPFSDAEDGKMAVMKGISSADHSLYHMQRGLPNAMALIGLLQKNFKCKESDVKTILLGAIWCEYFEYDKVEKEFKFSQRLSTINLSGGIDLSIRKVNYRINMNCLCNRLFRPENCRIADEYNENFDFKLSGEFRLRLWNQVSQPYLIPGSKINGIWSHCSDYSLDADVDGNKTFIQALTQAGKIRIRYYDKEKNTEDQVTLPGFSTGIRTVNDMVETLKKIIEQD